MKPIIIFILFLLSFFAFGCATQINDVEFAYFAKPQENRTEINDVFFNSTHSAYKKFRKFPDEPVGDDEVAIFDEKKLPQSYHPASNEFMYALVETMEKLDFFVLGRSVGSFKEAINIFKSQDYIKQCFVLIVDGNVTIVLPPKSPGRHVSKAQVEAFNDEMKKFQKYGEIYIAYSGEFKRVNVETNSGLEAFLEELERTRRVSNAEREDIDEHRDERDRIHGDN